MLIFTEVYQETWFLILMCVLGVIVAVFLLVFLSIFFLHSSARRQVRELETRYNTIHDSFSTDCSNMIKRIESISKQNSTYVQIFDSVQARFASILKENDKQCYIAVDSLKKIVGNKEFKGIKPIIDSTKSSMDEFEKISSQLNNDLQNLLHPEEECCSMAVALKERFRSLKDKYNANATALESLKGSFDLLFNHITDAFAKFEDYLNCADYTSAKKLLPQVEKLISAADKVMGDLPYLNTLADKVIPDKIKELNDTYHEMEKDYPLHHLMLTAAIEEMKNEVADCKKKLTMLSINGVQDCFNKITMDINEFFGDFEKEKEAKKIFDTKQTDIDSSTYQCEKQYANLITMLPNYCKYYKIDQTYLNQIKAIKDMIDEMSTRKRTLDSYINSSTKQPYSMLVTTIDDLEQKVQSIQKAFDDFHDYLKELKASIEKAFAYVREGYTLLKEADFDLREMDVENFTNVMRPNIDKGMKMLTDLDKELKVLPIDVMKVNSDYNDVHVHITKFLTDLNEAKNNQKRAEDLIVYDNRFRKDSDEADNKLSVAQNSFSEGDFTRAATVAADIYKSCSIAQRK